MADMTLEAKMTKIGQLHVAIEKAKRTFAKVKTYENAAAVQDLKRQVETLRATLPALRVAA